MTSTNNSKCWERCGGNMDPYTVLGGMQINAANMEIIMDISQKN
jgi:hypothetical protein